MAQHEKNRIINQGDPSGGIIYSLVPEDLK